MLAQDIDGCRGAAPGRTILRHNRRVTTTPGLADDPAAAPEEPDDPDDPDDTATGDEVAATDKPGTGKPSTGKPATGKSRSGKPSAGRPHASDRARPVVPLPLGIVAALLGGLAQLIAFPPYDQWWAAPVGVALLAVAVHRRRARSGLLLGWVTGLGLFVPLLSWTSIVVGHWPWPIVLAAVEALYLGLMGAAAAAASRLADRWRWTWPLLTGVLWVAQEALRDRLPWGGFPWGRVAFSQQDGPLAGLAALGGAPLLTFAVGLAGGLLAVTALGVTYRRDVAWTGPDAAPAVAPRLGSPVRGLAALVAAGLVVLSWLAVPGSTPGGPQVVIAVVQGNVPRLGLEFNAQRRAVLDNHVNATLALAAQVKAGTAQRPDLVVWPENSSDIDPLVNGDAYARIDEAANTIGAPILVGAVLEGPGTHARNAGIVWDPRTGPESTMYVKQHPVPFAEYIPMRSLARQVTDKVDLVRSDFLPGHRTGVLRVGPATVGDVICFEIGYDNLVRDTVVGGANLLTVQTNNADFNTAEARQQLAMVRERAVEHGRPALMASTVGVSAFVDAGGGVHQATRFNTRAVIEETTRLGTGETLATRLGDIPEIVLTAAAVAALAGAAALRWQQRRATSGRGR
jgi:apolipoprotein N-acyltransferase